MVPYGARWMYSSSGTSDASWTWIPSLLRPRRQVRLPAIPFLETGPARYRSYDDRRNPQPRTGWNSGDFVTYHPSVLFGHREE
jgi:hypothetical protein